MEQYTQGDFSSTCHEKSRDKNIFFERVLVSKSQNRPMNCIVSFRQFRMILEAFPREIRIIYV